MARVPRSLTDVPGVRVGHSSTPDGRSGVTVVRFAAPVPCVADVRGGASATYDVASLSLESTFGRRWALFLSGGSLYGLDAAAGVRDRILTEGDGHRAFSNPHPIVPVSGAALFDLPTRLAPVPDYRALGDAAARAASQARVGSGRIGAGSGASVGKYLGRRRASPGGLGSAAERLRGLGWVGVLLVLNSVGAVRDPSNGRWVAGARGRDGAVVPPTPFPARPRGPPVGDGTNLAVVVVQAALPRPDLARIAILAQAGLARCIVPLNTATDGDVVFVASSGEGAAARPGRRPGEAADRLGAAAAELVVQAALEAVDSG